MRLLPLIACALLAACNDADQRVVDFNTIPVRMPGGQTIRAEVMTNPRDQARGMMFRDSLAPDRGMLFVHENESNRPYWMFQVKIPLDLIWMDSAKRVVEIVPNAPPCDVKDPQKCPNYGGTKPSRYVLELAGGQAAHYGVQVGSVIDF